MLKGDDLATYVASIISFCGSMIIIATFFVCKKWSHRLRDVKLILIILSFFNLIAAANYMFDSSSTNGDKKFCRVQASSIQFFEINGIIYEGMLAFEVMCVVIYMKNTNVPAYTNQYQLATFWRHFAYHSLTLSFGIASVTYMNVNHDFEDGGVWCWYKKPLSRIYFGYIPLWINILVIISCDLYVVITIILIVNQQILSRAPGDTSISRQSSIVQRNQNNRTIAYNKSLFLRFTLSPLLFCLLHIPGSINRYNEAFGENDGDISLITRFQSILDPSHGTITCLVWVLSDPSVRNEWIDTINQITRIYVFGSFSDDLLPTSLPVNRNEKSVKNNNYIWSIRSSMDDRGSTIEECDWGPIGDVGSLSEVEEAEIRRSSELIVKWSI